MCVKDSLSNLNQLIYQAIIQDKLSEINKNDMIDYSIKMTESGWGAAVKYIIFRGELWGIELLDLVVLNLDMFDLGNSLCRISTHISLGDFDDTVDIEARIIDENLNAYAGFTHKLMCSS